MIERRVGVPGLVDFHPLVAGSGVMGEFRRGRRPQLGRQVLQPASGGHVGGDPRQQLQCAGTARPTINSIRTY